jgi:CRP-like cAMP-binding protein
MVIRRRRYNRYARREFAERGPIWQYTEWEHKMLLPLVTRLHLQAGRTLMRQGTRDGQFVMLVKGSAAVFRDGIALEKLGPGSHIGGLTAIYGLPHPTEVISDTPVDIDVISERAFRSVVPLLDTFKARVRQEIDRQRRDWCAPSTSDDAAAGQRDGERLRVYGTLASTALWSRSG